MPHTSSPIAPADAARAITSPSDNATTPAPSVRQEAAAVGPSKPNRRVFMSRAVASVASASVATLATAPAIASPPIAGSEAAALARCQHIVDVLRNSFVRDGWAVDEGAAERALHELSNADRGDDTFENVRTFLRDHGQSLDWVFDGDPGGMIARLASRSRRAAVTAAPDPIVVAIDERTQIYRKWDKLSDQLDEAEGVACEKEWRPGELVQWRNRCIAAPSEFKRVRRELIEEGELSRGTIEAEYKDALERARAARRAVRDWYKRHGLAALQRETERALKDLCEADNTLAKIWPTTVAGAALLVRHVGDDMQIGDQDWHRQALATAAAALDAMSDYRRFEPVIDAARQKANGPVIAATDDPILAAIELHRERAASVYAAADIWAELTRDDPGYDDRSREVADGWDAAHAAARSLTEILPTTLAGVLDLARYAAELTVDENGGAHPDLLEDDNEPEGPEGGGTPFTYYLYKNIASALSLIAGDRRRHGELASDEALT